MRYEEALEIWAIRKLTKDIPSLNDETKWTNINVDIEINPGYSCCGGRDPDCYCSFAESPSVSVVIEGVYMTNKKSRKKRQTSISSYQFDFMTMIRELSEINEENEND